MTSRELLKKIETKDGKENIAEQIARVWWDRMDMGDVEDYYIRSTIFGCKGLMNCDIDEWLFHAIEAGIVEDK